MPGHTGSVSVGNVPPLALRCWALVQGNSTPAAALTVLSQSGGISGTRNAGAGSYSLTIPALPGPAAVEVRVNTSNGTNFSQAVGATASGTSLNVQCGGIDPTSFYVAVYA